MELFDWTETKNNEITGEKKNKEKQKRKNHLDIFDKLLGKFFS
jgi:hypothetical protein